MSELCGMTVSMLQMIDTRTQKKLLHSQLIAKPVGLFKRHVKEVSSERERQFGQLSDDTLIALYYVETEEGAHELRTMESEELLGLPAIARVKLETVKGALNRQLDLWKHLWAQIASDVFNFKAAIEEGQSKKEDSQM